MIELTVRTAVRRAVKARPTVILLCAHYLAHYLLFGSCATGVHGTDPAEPVAGFEPLGHALGTGEL